MMTNVGQRVVNSDYSSVCDLLLPSIYSEYKIGD